MSLERGIQYFGLNLRKLSGTNVAMVGLATVQAGSF